MEKENAVSARSLQLILPLCFIFLFFLQSFTKELSFDLTQEFIEIDEPLEEKWVFEQNPYEYIIRKMSKN